MTDDPRPSQIGPFVVLRKLGEGGMGVVYAGYDVALDRKVALKLIRRQMLHRAEVRARMLREAQAMARLSHPNVVQVYQVGEHGDEIYVAMEYVEGQTLMSWVRAEPRAWQTVLRTVVAAGRGLAAAHAAGLVHRDFKPDNVLVGRDGRPCVLDFGLVHAGSSATALDGVDVRASASGLPTVSRISLPATISVGASGEHFDAVRLTQAGKILGTPAYMSPEQHFGEEVGPASDQFSFGITLYEALYGARPFPGASWDEIKRQIRLGEIPSPPRDAAVPGRIFRILCRSLAPNPDMRWPDLAQMLDVLERDPGKRALRIAGVVAIAGVAAAGSYTVALARHAESQRCNGAAHELAGAWDDARSAAAGLAFERSGSPLAATTWPRVRGRLDAYATAWIAGRTRACEAHADGSQSAGLFDRRTACLARRRAHLAALVDVFVAADRSVVENAVQATAALPGVESCSDPDALLAVVAAPDEPQTAARVESSRGQLARVAALEGTGQYTRGLQLAREVRGAAASLRYPPLDAEAALREGSVLLQMADAGAAELALADAVRLAVRHGLDELAAEAAAKRIFVLGDGLGRRDAALAGEPVAEALAARARDDGRLSALLHNNVGAVHELAGDHERAREHYLRTLELLARRPGEPDPLIGVVHHNLGGMFKEQGRDDQAREQFERAVAAFAEVLGEQHPMIAHPIGGAADLALRRGEYAAAAAGYARSLAIMEASYGADHIYLLHPLIGIGKVHAAAADRTAAAESFRRAVAIGERHGTVHPYYAEALAGLAEARADDPAEARDLLARAVAVYEAVGGRDHPRIAALAVRAGQLAEGPAAARRWYERAWNDWTGPADQAPTRARAALELAALLAADEPLRACALLDAAAADLPADQRPRADDLRAAICR